MLVKGLTLALCLQAATVTAFPGMGGQYQAYQKLKSKRAETCSSTYTGAGLNGLPGTQVGGKLVPCPGDTAHQFQAPGSGDIRGPCPGLNTAANHGFLSRNGITNFPELVYAQQNLYNVGYDLAVLLAVIAISLDGDLINTRLSLGKEATSQTAALGTVQNFLGKEAGLNGHNLFEADTSLTRNDYFLANGDDYSFNGTLFGMMDQTCQSNFNLPNLAQYRFERYGQSLADNGNFYFGVKSLLLFGAASFLYELFAPYGPEGNPDLPTMQSFFGAERDGNGGWRHIPERIPPNWHNRRAPYTINDVGSQIFEMYLLHPVLFGGNAGKGNFLALGTAFGAISADGTFNPQSANDVKCLLYQLATDNVPSSLGNVAQPMNAVTQNWVLGKLNPLFVGSGCPLRLPDKK